MQLSVSLLNRVAPVGSLRLISWSAQLVALSSCPIPNQNLLQSSMRLFLMSSLWRVVTESGHSAGCSLVLGSKLSFFLLELSWPSTSRTSIDEIFLQALTYSHDCFHWVFPQLQSQWCIWNCNLVRKSASKVVRITLLVYNTAIITCQWPKSPCKYREPLAWRMAPLAKSSVTRRYKTSYGRRLAKSAILTSFEADLRIVLEFVLPLLFQFWLAVTAMKRWSYLR